MLRAALPEGNRLSFGDSKNNPDKTVVSGADLPELMIYFSGLSGNLHQNSDSCKFTLSYTVRLSTGSYDSTLINRLLFGVIAALLNWKNSLHTVTYNGRQFIKDVRINPTPVGDSDPESNRNIRGWASVMGIELDVYLNSDLVMEYLQVELV